MTPKIVADSRQLLLVDMRKRGGRKPAAEAADFDDLSSLSDSTFNDLTGGLEDDEFEHRTSFEVAIDALYEKRWVSTQLTVIK